MPNWCYNRVEVYIEDEKEIKRWKEAVESKESKFDFNKISITTFKSLLSFYFLAVVLQFFILLLAHAINFLISKGTLILGIFIDFFHYRSARVEQGISRSV